MFASHTVFVLTESHALPFIISLLFNRDMKYISNLESEHGDWGASNVLLKTSLR